MPHTLSDEFERLRLQVRHFVQEELEPISLAVETREQIPEPIVDRMRQMGLFGLAIPKTYGGLGLTTLQEVMIYEEITQTNGCYRSRIGTSNGIGSMGIVYDGTAAQKEFYLPRIARGEWSSAFALTEPNAGSDASNIATTAVLDGDHWVLNGNKIFITNADQAQLFTTIAVTDEEKRARGGVTAFIVERGMPGFSIGAADVKMGLKGSHTNELIFKDCRVPAENVIGGMPMVGQGFKTAMRVLDKGRLCMAACALGAAQKIMTLCIQRMREKRQASTAGTSSQAAEFMLADMATQIFAARQMLYQAARLRDDGKQITSEASMAKIFCTEMASRVADDALQLFEEEGLLTAHQVEILLRDVRLYRIYEGTSEIQRLIVSRGLLKS